VPQFAFVLPQQASVGSTRTQRACALPRALGLLLGVAIGVQACGDGATEPTPAAGGTFTLTAAQAPVPVLQGGTGEANIAIVRSGGFAGSVTLAVTGVPAGVTATMNPSITTGTTSTLVVTTAAAVATGNATVTITGTATGRPDQTTTATVVIVPSPGGAGNVTIDFSACPAALRPIWFAYQDGSGPWTQTIGSADVYRFDVVSAKGGYAFVSRSPATAIRVSLATRAELTRSTISACDPTSPGAKRLSGTVSGLATSDVVYLGMGGPNPDPDGGPIAASFTLAGLQNGNQDLIAYRSNPVALGMRDRAIIRRDQNIASGGTIPTIDFDAAESFAPAAATVTITGAVSPRFGNHMAYFTGPRCSYYDLYDESNSGVQFTMRGIPGAQQRATDFHAITMSATNPDRFTTEVFHTLADRTIAMPSAIPEPAITAPPGGHKRLQATLTLPSEYQTSLQLWFYTGGADASVSASFGWLGGSAATLALPDFSGVTGWSQSFLPASGTPVNWFLVANGANTAAADGLCAENARFVTAYRGGSQ
jgi:hypothetical protein